MAGGGVEGGAHVQGPCTPTAEEQDSGGDEDDEDDEETPWWERSKQLLEESAKKNQGNKSFEMGSMLVGSLFSLFTPKKEPRATPEELERQRQQKEKKEQEKLAKKIKMWDAAEKFKNLMESKTVMLGHLCATDETDTMLWDASLVNPRPMLDAEDAEDTAWLHTGDDEDDEEKRKSRITEDVDLLL